MLLFWLASFLVASCSLVVSVFRESVTSTVNLVAVLDKVPWKFSADQVISNVIAEIVSWILVHFLPVEKRETVVARPFIIISSIFATIWLLCNDLVVLLEIYCEVAIGGSIADLKGHLGREIECSAGSNFNLGEAKPFLSLFYVLVGPEEVVDDLFAVEDVDKWAEGVEFWAEGVRDALLAVHSALKVLKL